MSRVTRSTSWRYTGRVPRNCWPQNLCDEVIDQTRALAQTRTLMRSLNRNLAALAEFYDGDWLAISASKHLTDDDERLIQEAAAKGRYSILAQDTIWDALQDARQAQLALTRLLARNLRC